MNRLHGNVPPRPVANAGESVGVPLRRLRSLDAIATTVSCHRGQEICSQGDQVEYWYRIVSGAAKIAVIQRNGKRQIIDLLLPGDFVAVAGYVGTAKIQSGFTRDRASALTALREWATSSASGGSGSWAGALSALREIAREAAPIQRRKNLVAFVGDLGAPPPVAELARTAKALNVAGVATYTLELDSPLRRPELIQLARGTAARYFPIAAGLSLPLANILRQNRGYYLVSFVPLNEPDSGEHHAMIAMRGMNRYHVYGLPRQWPSQ